LALAGARLARPFKSLLPARLKPMLDLAPRSVPPASPIYRAQIFPAEGARQKRVALMAVCAQQVLAPQIDEATVRLLTRRGCEVVIAAGAACCGSLTHHMGRDSRAMMKANIDAWMRESEGEGLDAIVINVSGCGVTVKDYGYTFRDDPLYAEKAAKVSALARDVSEFLSEIGLGTVQASTGQRVAYHAACSLQHGQRILAAPKALLAEAGFTVLDVPEGHLCCGSAGTYNMLQPELATALRERKVANIESVSPELVAAGNIGCLTQIASATALPVVHTVELLDWATGGPMPPALGATSRR
jgi:glycolate oxidase iron-sulfur subunit